MEDASPHRELGVPPSRFERWIIGGRLTNYGRIFSTKFREKSDSEGETLLPLAKTFFFGLRLILAKKHFDFWRRPFSFLVFIQYRRRNHLLRFGQGCKSVSPCKILQFKYCLQYKTNRVAECFQLTAPERIVTNY